MNIGDRVQTTQEWNEKYLQDGLRGIILKLPSVGMPIHPDRNHYVALDKPFKKYKHLWFHPNDLEPET